MQLLKDIFYSTRLGDGGLLAEHQVLVAEQQSCRDRARKFSLETNRRRKALEERRRRWDVQEERLRETVLQQRKQRVQDATERFQRAHLPPSQRRRPAFRRNSPSVEEALSHIGGTFSSYGRQSFLSSSSTLSRSCTPSPKPPTAPHPSRHQRAVSAAQAYTKLLQERTVHSFKNGHLLFLSELQETDAREREASGPQDSHMNPNQRSESLSSLDSLENHHVNNNNNNTNTNHNHATNTNHDRATNAACSSRSSPEHAEAWGVEEARSGPPPSDQTLSSTKTLTLLLQQQSEACPRHAPASTQEGPEEPNKRLHSCPSSTRGPNSVEKSLTAEAQPPPSTVSLPAPRGTAAPQTDARRCQNSPENDPSDKITALPQSKAARESTPLEFARPTQDGKLDRRQHAANQEDGYSHLKQPSATKIFLHTKNHDRDDVLPQTHAAREQTAAQQTATGIASQSHKSNDAMNNLNKGSDRSRLTGPINQTCEANLRVRPDIPECLSRPGDETPDSSSGDVISGRDPKVRDVRFVKGILKKQSRYVSGDAKAKYGAAHLTFTKQVALSIRDSVELTRMKAKEDDAGNRVVRKKLRWFDEVNVEEEEEEKEMNTNALEQNHTRSTSACYPAQHQSPSADHHQSASAAPGGPRGGPAATPPASTGYHFTKRAWTDVGVEDGAACGRGEEVRVQPAGARAGGPRAPPRVLSARVGPAPVSSRPRKGAVIRPQSASEAGRVARSQGKVMAPRPPPRAADPPPAATQGPSVEQASSRDAPPHTQGVGADSGVISTPLPPSYAQLSPDGAWGGGRALAGQPGPQGGAGRAALCVDHTPTDEEISQLWHGVRSALASKDGHAHLSHVTINGESLVSGVRTLTRMGGFFLAPSNARNLVRRAAPESAGARWRSAEPGRQAGPGVRRLPSYLPSQTAFPITPWPSTYDLTQLDNGPEGAAQLRLAEPPGDALLVDADMAAGMETQSPSQPRGLTGLSLEEQKVLLSLDRLDQRLHYVREFVGGRAAANAVLRVHVPYAGEGAVQRQQRGVSADSRPRTHKRF